MITPQAPRWRDIVRAQRAYLAGIQGDDDAVANALAEVDDEVTAARTLAALIVVGSTLAKRRLQDPVGYFESWIQVSMLKADTQDADSNGDGADQR